MSGPESPTVVVDPELLVCTCTVKGGKMYTNEAWEAIFGCNDMLWSHLAPEERVFASECITEAASGSLVTNQVFQIQSPEREEPLPVLLSFLPLHAKLEDDQGPRIIGVVISGEVLSEPTTWTAGQTQRRRMEMLGRMTMGIVHDFNNLLSSILGYTELLKTSLPVILPNQTYKKHLHTIEQAALDGAALVRKIQRYVRQDKEARFEPIDLREIIEDGVSLTRPYWHNEPSRRGISIDVDLQLDPIPMIMGSGVELREVVVNMMLNAVQAMPEGGKLSIATRLEAGIGVIVEIADSGIGMSEHVRNRIFEPLFTTKGMQGTGMGLAVSYGIIQEHEGIVNVQSRPGKGTKFTIVFPPAKTVVKKEVDPVNSRPGIRVRIIVVDDERAIRNILVKLLAIKGHAVQQAASATEAIDMIERQPFDVVITDLGMPGMSGRELAQVLRVHHSHLKIILLTGHTDVEDHGPDVDIVLGKPFKIDALEATIQSLLDRNDDRVAS